MDKNRLLDLLMLLSALESWSFSSNTRMPDYLLDQLHDAAKELAAELLK